MLEVDIPKDTPLFRASLAHLEHRAHLLSKSCKSTLLSAQTVSDCLDALRTAEMGLMDDLARLDSLLGEQTEDDDRVAGKGTSSRSTPGVSNTLGAVEDVKVWLARRREEEKERLEGVLMRRLRGLKSHLKGRGVGNGTALSQFEVSPAETLPVVITSSWIGSTTDEARLAPARKYRPRADRRRPSRTITSSPVLSSRRTTRPLPPNLPLIRKNPPSDRYWTKSMISSGSTSTLSSSGRARQRVSNVWT